MVPWATERTSSAVKGRPDGDRSLLSTPGAGTLRVRWASMVALSSCATGGTVSTSSVAMRLSFSTVAVMMTVVRAYGGRVTMRKVPVVAPGAIVNVAGTSASRSDAAKVTTVPVGGAAALSVTSP